MKTEKAEIRIGLISQVTINNNSWPVSDLRSARQVLYRLGYRRYYTIAEHDTAQKFEKEIWGRFAPERGK